MLTHSPREGPETSQNGAVDLYLCRDCGEQFYPKARIPKGWSAICPNCSSSSTTRNPTGNFLVTAPDASPPPASTP